ADVKRPPPDSMPNRLDQVVFLKFVQQSESVATTNKNNLRLPDCTQSIRNVVGRRKIKSHLAQAASGLYTVCAPIVKCIGNKCDASPLAHEISDFSLDMIEVAATVHRGVANQQES